MVLLPWSREKMQRRRVEPIVDLGFYGCQLSPGEEKAREGEVEGKGGSGRPPHLGFGFRKSPARQLSSTRPPRKRIGWRSEEEGAEVGGGVEIWWSDVLAEVGGDSSSSEQR